MKYRAILSVDRNDISVAANGGTEHEAIERALNDSQTLRAAKEKDVWVQVFFGASCLYGCSLLKYRLDTEVF